MTNRQHLPITVITIQEEKVLLQWAFYDNLTIKAPIILWDYVLNFNMEIHDNHIMIALHHRHIHNVTGTSSWFLNNPALFGVYSGKQVYFTLVYQDKQICMQDICI